MIQSDGTYTKRITIHNRIYEIRITNQEWKSVPYRQLNNHISYVVRQLRIGKQCELKYGTIHVIDSINHICSSCEKIYKTRSGLLRHIKNKHYLDGKDLTTHISQPVVSTTQNIKNQTNHITNNIQQNITIRPFGKENPKWITEKVIVDALRNIPNAMMNLIKEKHFNDKFPENRNVELCNEFRNRYLMVQEDSRKQIVDRKTMFMRMCDDACDAVTTTLESYSEPADDTLENEDESPEDRRCRLVASRIRRSEHFSEVVDRYIDKWQNYVEEVEHDEVLKKADHYITMLLLDLKLALAHEDEMINTREVADCEIHPRVQYKPQA
jgi:hypothetical protein